MRQILLQYATTILLQNATEVYYKMRQGFYYKMRQFSYKNVTFITKCDDFITKCDSFTKCDVYYKLRQYEVQLKQTFRGRLIPFFQNLNFKIRNNLALACSFIH